MLDIILLYFICRHIHGVALRKRLKPLQWKIITILAWMVCETMGFFISVSIFGLNKDNMWGMMALWLVCGFGGYLIVRAILEKMPDNVRDDYDRPEDY